MESPKVSAHILVKITLDLKKKEKEIETKNVFKARGTVGTPVHF